MKAAAAVLTGLLLAGCGSTVPLGTTATNSGAPGSDLSLGTGSTAVSGIGSGTAPGELAVTGPAGSGGLASTEVPATTGP